MAVAVPQRKRGRPAGGRAFDHALARSLRAGGMTYVALASMFEVTPKSVRRACSRPPTLQLDGPRCQVTDGEWRALEAWIERRHGHAGSYSRSQVSPRTVIPRATR